MSTERELFEAWALSRKCPPELLEAGGDYGGRGLIAGQWAAWQAARSADTSALWQPIDSAPMDGTVIGVWRPRQPGTIAMVRWAHHLGIPTQPMAWCTATKSIAISHLPTHWMPLPEPPPAAPGGPAGALRPDENSPSGPSDRALNPQPEAVDHDRGAL